MAYVSREPTKKCAKCNQFKSYPEFANSNYSKDGKRYRCRECESEDQRDFARRRLSSTEPLRTISEKKCTNCKEIKSIEEFNRSRRSGDGHVYVCKLCRNVLHNSWARGKGSGVVRNYYLRSKYGISTQTFREMYESQGGKCRLCEGSLGFKPCVDHCHETGQIRDLLCNSCNSLLGGIERGDYMEKALAYILRHHPIKIYPIARAVESTGVWVISPVK